MQMQTKPLTQQRLRELLNYDPDTGVFTNRITRSSRAQAGAVVGSLALNGYVTIRIDHALHYAHRLAWLYMTGAWPAGDIDHRDCQRANNRWENLRDVTRRTNQENRRTAPTNSTTGMLGVCPDKRRGGVRAQIVVAGKQKHLGKFATADEGHEAYIAAKRRLHAGCTL